MEYPFNDDLKCSIQGIRIDDKNEDTVIIYCPDNNVVDMRGAIKIATFILPSVTDIIAVMGDCIDITYQRRGRKWVSTSLRGAYIKVQKPEGDAVYQIGRIVESGDIEKFLVVFGFVLSVCLKMLGERDFDKFVSIAKDEFRDIATGAPTGKRH